MGMQEDFCSFTGCLSISICQRVPIPPILWRPAIILSLPLFQILSDPSFLFLLPYSFCWMCHHATSNVSFCFTDLNLLNFGTLVTAVTYCIHYAIRHQICWRFDTDSMVWHRCYDYVHTAVTCITFTSETLKYWVGVQWWHSYLIRIRCLFSLGWPPF